MINCCDNLNRSSLSQSVSLTEDTATTINVSTTSTVILVASPNRKLVKIFAVSLSVGSQLWIRYGGGASLSNSAHILPQGHLLIIDGKQAANAISAICSAGTAQLRVSSAF